MKKQKQFQINYKAKSFGEILNIKGNIRDVFYMAYALIYPELKFGIKTSKHTIYVTSNAQLLHAVDNNLEAINKFFQEQLPNSFFIEFMEMSFFQEVQKYTIAYKQFNGSLVEFKGLTLAEATEHGLNQLHKEWDFSVTEKNDQLEASFNHTPDGDFSLLTFENNPKSISSWFNFNIIQYNLEYKFMTIVPEGEE